MNIPPFFLELAQRWVTKTPKFFKTLQRVSSVCSTIVLLPVLLNQTGIEVPEVMSKYVSITVAVAGYVVAFVSQLAKDDTVATTSAQ